MVEDPHSDGTQLSANSETRGIVAIPENNRVLMQLSGSGITAVSLLELRGMMDKTPGMAVQLVHAAYAYPGLIDITPPTIQLNSNQKTIRANLPTTLELLSQGKAEEILNQNPRVDTMVQQDLTALGDLASYTNTGEVMIRRVIQTATLRSLTIENYPDIVSMQGVYKSVADIAFADEGRLSITESEYLKAIGQGLLRRAGLIEADTTKQINSNGSRIRSTNPLTDYAGSLASWTAARRLREGLIASGEKNSSDRITALEEMISAERNHLLTNYPERYPELRRLFGIQEGSHKYYGWAEVEGAPDLTRAEITDFLNPEGYPRG